MPSRRSYTDRDKALVYITLNSNEGNVRRTARDTGVPVMTVHTWKTQWQKEGFPEEILESLESTVTTFIDEAEEVRDLTLKRMRTEIEDPSSKIALNQLATTFGILDDKVTRARGLPTTRQENVMTLPNGDDIRELFQGFVKGIILAAQERHDIIEAEVVEISEQSSKELTRGE